MIVVITGPENGIRYEITGAAETVLQLITEHAERINAVSEGRVVALIWPDGGVELSVTEMIAEGCVEERAASVREYLRQKGKELRANA